MNYKLENEISDILINFIEEFRDLDSKEIEGVAISTAKDIIIKINGVE